MQKRVSVRTACALTELLWPDFVEVNGCIFAAFQRGDGEVKISGDKTGTECFINHTHLLDEFSNRATSETREHFSEQLDVVEAIYDYAHPDFIAACELGTKMAEMWALKLKSDFPKNRFRVYYTKYDNPIVRFHKVRSDEPLWLSNEALQTATDPSFRDAVIHDTDFLDRPIRKNSA
ncbi:MAG TPA: hypothetical protein VHA06_01410 [Candidatus Angelobacter sp.]|jgi:hypothetical protein|nr:hypothetical protein [Candidatus Angelobacter sp.]